MKRILFTGHTGFRSELERRVAAYFSEKHMSPRDNVGMYVKAALILSVFVLSYVILVFYPTNLIVLIAAAGTFAFANLAVGFNIQHDGSHKAFSKHAWINRLAAMTLDFVGKSSYLWHWQHDISHHTNTNLAGYDVDVMFTPFIRLTTVAPRRWYHKYQHWYTWVIYGFGHLSFLFGDVFKMLRLKKTHRTIPAPKGFDLAWFILAKCLYCLFMFGLPLYFYPWWAVALVYLGISVTIGLVYSVIAQSAHMNDLVEHPEVTGEQLEEDWHIHQVKTTADFATNSKVLTCLLGGLNCQAVHHLNARVSHIHYRALVPILRQLCKERGVKYREYPTLFSAIASHYRYLRLMGTAEA